MGASWTYLLADLRTNAITAELALSGVSLSKRVGDTGTGSGTLKLSAKTSGDPYTLTTPGRTALYALADGKPWWGGVLWTRRYNSASQEVQLGAADWWSYYDHRKVLPVIVGDGSDTAGLQVTYSGLDQNEIARQLLAGAHAHTGGNIGVTVVGGDSGTIRDQTFAGFELVDVGEALRNLSKLENGPDLMFDVAPTLDGNGRPQRILRIGTPWLGQQGAPHVFEYGGNLASYSWPSDASRMVLRQWVTGDGLESGTTIAMAANTVRLDDGWPLLEAQQSRSTELDTSVLQAQANGAMAAAGLPVALPELTLVPGSQPGLGEFAPGDDARVCVTDPFFATGLDTRMRIVAVSVRPGEQETVTVTMGGLLEDVT